MPSVSSWAISVSVGYAIGVLELHKKGHGGEERRETTAQYVCVFSGVLFTIIFIINYYYHSTHEGTVWSLVKAERGIRAHARLPYTTTDGLHSTRRVPLAAA